MKIVLVLEGSYPYVHGGVSTWVHDYIQSMPDCEFLLWTICSLHQKGRFVYELPDQVVEIKELVLDKTDKSSSPRPASFPKPIYEELTHLVQGEELEWSVLFDYFQEKNSATQSYLQSPALFQLLLDMVEEKQIQVGIADFIHTQRSILSPLLRMLQEEPPQGDIYHALSTGYAGVLAALGSHLCQKPFILSEHGLYCREREEEILQSDWIHPAFKFTWIQHFRQLARLAYKQAACVTSLFGEARNYQIAKGADPKVCLVIPNGIDYASWSQLECFENAQVTFGAVVRLAPIKDIHTLIYAWAEVEAQLPQACLEIMGGEDDADYARSCYELVESLQLQRVFFKGRVEVRKKMADIDVVVLTSISEGQPLSILEGMAAGRPCIVTDVGACRELMDGREDEEVASAGRVVDPMNRKQLADAFLELASSYQKRLQMGNVGRERVERFYQHADMIKGYTKIYEEVQDGRGRTKTEKGTNKST